MSIERASSTGTFRIDDRLAHTVVPQATAGGACTAAGGLLRKAWTTWLAYAIRRKQLGRAVAMIETRVSAAVGTSLTCKMPAVMP